MKNVGKREIKMIREIVRQGNQDQIQVLFDEIFKAHCEEFREDNLITLSSFISGMLFRSFYKASEGYIYTGKFTKEDIVNGNDI